MELYAEFLSYAQTCVKPAQERARLQPILEAWTSAWQGRDRAIEFTRSVHGVSLHFAQRIGTIWSQVFTWQANNRDGVFLKGPDTDRGRKSHKFRANPLDTEGLDALFQAWSAHPEGHPAGLAVVFYLQETHDDTLAACLQEALTHLTEPEPKGGRRPGK